MLRVAVLLAAYNGEAFIGKQLDTILAQKGVVVDVFVSLDHSDDATLSIVERYVAVHSNIYLVSKGRKFGSAAANFFYLTRVVNLNSYEFVAFSDQDDIWFEDKLLFAISEMKRCNAAGFSSNIIAYWPESGMERLVTKAGAQTNFDHWFESPGPGCSQVFRVDAFSHFQNFVKANSQALSGVDYHDWIVYAYFKFHSMRWLISPVAKMYYVQHGGNQIGANSGFKAQYARFSMIRSRWYRKQVNLIYRLVSGDPNELINFRFMLFNLFELRRNGHHSIVIFILFLMRIL